MKLDVEKFNAYTEHAFKELTKDFRALVDFYFLFDCEVLLSKFHEHVISIILKLLKWQGY